MDKAIEYARGMPEMTQPRSALEWRIATIFRWTHRSPQDLAPERCAQLCAHPFGCPGVFGPVPQPVSMDGRSLPAASFNVNLFIRMKRCLMADPPPVAFPRDIRILCPVPS
jgi:hypothetical protein